jgi:Thioredoxin
MPKPSALTPERFASGLTFTQWLVDIATPENLGREASMNRPRRDWSAQLRAAYEAIRLSEAQAEALKWLASQPGGPAKVLVIGEEWSSDVRRDVPMLARMAETAGWELRIFRRDGQRFSGSPKPSPAESPTADLMEQFLNEKNGQTWQSIPVAVFYTKGFEYLYHYTEYPAIYHKDRVVGRIRAPRGGESTEEAQKRGDREFMELQQSAFFRLWASAAADEIISALHERVVVGP